MRSATRNCAVPFHERSQVQLTLRGWNTFFSGAYRSPSSPNSNAGKRKEGEGQRGQNENERERERGREAENGKGEERERRNQIEGFWGSASRDVKPTLKSLLVLALNRFFLFFPL